MLRRFWHILNNFVHFENVFQVINKTRQGNVIRKAKGLKPLEKYSNPLVIYYLGSHTQMMKWTWETKMTEKSKWLVTRHSRHKHKNIHRQIENSSLSKSKVLSEKFKCAIRRISDSDLL